MWYHGEAVHEMSFLRDADAVGENGLIRDLMPRAGPGIIALTK